jgi:hypothetical protein
MVAYAAQFEREGIGQKIGQIIFILFYAFVCWFPRLDRHLRFEDIVTPLVCIAALFLLTWSAWRVARIPIYLSVMATFVTTLLVAVEYLPVQALLILGKELQYVFIYILGLEVLGGRFLESKRFRVFLWLIIIVAAVFAVFGSFFAAKAGGYYGLGYMNEIDSPSLSALMYFNLFVLSIILLSMDDRRRQPVKRWLLIGLSVVLVIATLLVGSRTAVMAVLVFTSAYFIMRGRHYRWLALAFLLVAIPSVIWVGLIVRVERLYDYLYNFESEIYVLQAAVSRASTLLILDETLEGSRYGSWTLMLSSFLDSNVVTMLLGCGRGCSHLGGAEFSVGLGGDNQYTVNIVELGLVGLALSLVAAVSAYPYIDRRWKVIYVAYVLAYFAWGMTAEVWQLSKGAQMFWFVNALLVGLSFTRAAAERGRFSPRRAAPLENTTLAPA